jgi:hypothetical protein
MSMSKTALLSLLVACWIVGLVNQFHAWDMTLRYLVLSLLLVAIVAANRCNMPRTGFRDGAKPSLALSPRYCNAKKENHAPGHEPKACPRVLKI